jgi:hypothetical protein
VLIFRQFDLTILISRSTPSQAAQVSQDSRIALTFTTPLPQVVAAAAVAAAGEKQG